MNNALAYDNPVELVELVERWNRWDLTLRNQLLIWFHLGSTTSRCGGTGAGMALEFHRKFRCGGTRVEPKNSNEISWLGIRFHRSTGSTTFLSPYRL